jgi:2-phospho-L-lactate transferase/gluconeogenesis factor (CofD/UPF0052 family)
MVRAIRESPALKVFVCNVASQHGETDGFDVSDYLRVVREHAGGDLFDFVIVNSNLSHPPGGGQCPVRFCSEQAVREQPHVRFITGDVIDPELPSHHDPGKLARLLMQRIWLI